MSGRRGRGEKEATIDDLENLTLRLESEDINTNEVTDVTPIRIQSDVIGTSPSFIYIFVLIIMMLYNAIMV